MIRRFLKLGAQDISFSEFIGDAFVTELIKIVLGLTIQIFLNMIALQKRSDQIGLKCTLLKREDS